MHFLGYRDSNGPGGCWPREIKYDWYNGPMLTVSWSHRYSASPPPPERFNSAISLPACTDIKSSWLMGSARKAPDKEGPLAPFAPVLSALHLENIPVLASKLRGHGEAGANGNSIRRKVACSPKKTHRRDKRQVFKASHSAYLLRQVDLTCGRQKKRVSECEKPLGIKWWAYGDFEHAYRISVDTCYIQSYFVLPRKVYHHCITMGFRLW